MTLVIKLPSVDDSGSAYDAVSAPQNEVSGHPLNISGDCWWLSSEHGVTVDDGAVTEWSNRGKLAPGFRVKGAGITQNSDGDLVLPGDGESFFYEGDPLTQSSTMTSFGLIRFDESVPASGAQSILGKFVTGTDERSWVVSHSVDNSQMRFIVSSNGTSGGAAAVNGMSLLAGEPGGMWLAFVCRKATTAMTASFNGIQDDKTSVASSVFDSDHPVCIGGQGGDASTDCTSPFAGSVREIGYFDSDIGEDAALSLMHWLVSRMPDKITMSERVPPTGPYGLCAGSETFLVCAPSGATPTEADYDSHRYRHHPYVHEHAGRVWVSYSSCAVGEGTAGQMTMLISSADGGDTWGDIIQACPPQDVFDLGDSTAQKAPSRITFPRGFVEYRGRLFIVIACDQFTADYIYAGIALFAVECFPDGTTGTIFRISDVAYTPKSGIAAIDYDPVLGPPLYAYTRLYGAYGGTHPKSSGADTDWSNWQGRSNENTLVKPSTVMLDPIAGKMARFWRLDKGPMNEWHFVQFSYDGGETWHLPIVTTIPNAPSSSHAVRLPDGRIALVGNPQDQNPDGTPRRDPVALWLMTPTLTVQWVAAVVQGLSRTPVYPGDSKVGGGSYAAAWADARKIWVVYSTQKENIEVTRVDRV